MSERSRRSLCLALLALALPVPAVAGFNVWNSEYTATLPDLQAMIERRFPLSQRYAQVVTVVLADPRLGLNAAANRAAITVAVSITSPLLRAGQVDGTMALSSALRYDAAARALRLVQPKVERLDLRGVGGADAAQLQQVGTLVAEQLMDGQVLRTFTAEELTVGRQTYDIGDITVLADGIKVQLK